MYKDDYAQLQSLIDCNESESLFITYMYTHLLYLPSNSLVMFIVAMRFMLPDLEFGGVEEVELVDVVVMMPVVFFVFPLIVTTSQDDNVEKVQNNGKKKQ